MEIQLNNANCTGLSIAAPVQLASEGEKEGGFLIEAYTGATVERWWGKLAISIDGIKAKKQMPIFRDHSTGQIVGFADKSWKDGSFFVSGKFSEATESAREVKALADEGFPWQASIGVRPLKIMSIEEQAEMDVNGQTVKGPAEVWLESEVMETSFVPFGADDNTSVSCFSKFTEKEAPQGAAHKPNNEEKLMEITLEILAERSPELLAKIQASAKAKGHTEGLAAGATAEKNRIQEVLAQSMAGHDVLVQGLAFDGKTTGPEAAVQVLAAEKQLRGKALENLNNDAVPPVVPTNPADIRDEVPATKEAFAANAELVEEFGDFEAYAAYTAAVAAGQVKTLKNRSDK